MRAALAIGVAALVASAAIHAEAQPRRRGRRGPRATRGELVLQTSIEGAEVLIDEELAGVTPLDPVVLSAGTHTVRVRRPGYTEFSDVVTIVAGERLELPVDLMALSMVVTVRTSPEEARVFVDGTFRGTTPLELELIEGEHSVRIEHPGYREVLRTIAARPGETNAMDLTLEALPPSEIAAVTRPPEWFEEPWIWIGVGGGVVVVTLAVVLIAVFAQSGSQTDSFCLGTGGSVSGCVVRQAPEWEF